MDLINIYHAYAPRVEVAIKMLNMKIASFRREGVPTKHIEEQYTLLMTRPVAGGDEWLNWIGEHQITIYKILAGLGV